MLGASRGTEGQTHGDGRVPQKQTASRWSRGKGAKVG